MMDTTTVPADTARPDSPSARCDALIAKRDLLGHPFYQAWSAGTLPLAALRDYAGEYGAFIGTIADGWRTAGHDRIAAIEVGHARIWSETFATTLGTSVGTPAVSEVAALVATAEELFADPVTALGALYAFEAQQPGTARSKRSGLVEHYPELPRTAGLYFAIHEDDDEEPAMLAVDMDALGAADAERTVAACDRMTRALWDALSGVYAPHAEASATN